MVLTSRASNVDGVCFLTFILVMKVGSTLEISGHGSLIFGSMMRTREETQLTGATYIIAGSFICSWISLTSDPFAASALLVFACLFLAMLLLPMWKGFRAG